MQFREKAKGEDMSKRKYIKRNKQKIPDEVAAAKKKKNKFYDCRAK